MTRQTLMTPSHIEESAAIEKLRRTIEPEFDLWVDYYLLFLGDHQFDGFEYGFEHLNWRKKSTSIRYKTGHIRVPVGNKLFVFETSEFKNRLPPRGIVTIDKVVGCMLYEVEEEELRGDGFQNREQMLWEFCEMPGRYYQDMTPESFVSVYSVAYEPYKELPELCRVLEKKGIDLPN